jgi:hypothetical protein
MLADMTFDLWLHRSALLLIAIAWRNVAAALIAAPALLSLLRCMLHVGARVIDS